MRGDPFTGRCDGRVPERGLRTWLLGAGVEKEIEQVGRSPYCEWASAAESGRVVHAPHWSVAQVSLRCAVTSA